jgi:ABC-2 type transport system permease protein
MHKVWCIFRKDVETYFHSPVTYVVMGISLAICGYLFSAIVLGYQTADMRFVLSSIASTSLLVAPVLTMRSIAEERRIGTDELLMTSPISITEIIVGKYLAVVLVYVVMLVITLIYPLFLALLGHPDPGPIVSGYVGLLLLGGSHLAVGLFTSSLTENQVIAGMTSFGILLLLWMIGRIDQVLPGRIGTALAFLSLADHFCTFERGIIDTTEIFFFLSFIFFMIFLTIQAVDYRRRT